MAFYKKAYNKKTNVYYPRAITVGSAINTDQIAEALSDRSTVTKTDVKAVLTEMADVMAQYMAQGKSVKLEGLGSFRLGLSTKGVENEEDFDFQTQLQHIKVNFTPETTYPTATGTATRSMVSKGIEWIEYDKTQGAHDTGEEENPAGGGEDDELPLG